MINRLDNKKGHISKSDDTPHIIKTLYIFINIGTNSQKYFLSLMATVKNKSYGIKSIYNISFYDKKITK